MEFELDLDTDTVDRAHPRKPLCVNRDTTIRSVFKLMKDQNTSAAMVCENDRLVGIFTEKDAVKLLADGGDLERPISVAMIADPITLTAQDSVGKAIELMSVGRFRRLPVVDGAGKITGILKVSGIMHFLVEHFPKVVYTLPPSPHYKASDREGA